VKIWVNGIYEQCRVLLPIVGEVYNHPNGSAERGTGNVAHMYIHIIQQVKMVWTQHNTHTHTHTTHGYLPNEKRTHLKYQWLLKWTYGSVPERICCTECWPLIIFINRIWWTFEDTPRSCRRISSLSSARISPVMPSFEKFSLYCVRSIASSRFCTCR